jgi:hypothetical protein
VFSERTSQLLLRHNSTIKRSIRAEAYRKSLSHAISSDTREIFLNAFATELQTAVVGSVLDSGSGPLL